MFKAPPENLTPTLNTPQAAKSAEWYANLLMKYGPDGILSYSDDQAMRSQMSGRANMRTQAITWMRAARQARREHGAEDGALRPDAGGTVRQLPGLQQPWPGHSRRLEEEGSGVGVHQVGAVEGDHRQVVKEHGYPSVCRLSVIKSPSSSKC